MSLKYIVYAGHLCDEIVLFPSFRDHGDFSRQMGLQLNDILGAGFVSMNADNPPACWGRSISLEVMSRGERDTAILLRMSGYNDA